MLDLFRTLPGVLKDVDGAGAVREAIVFAAWRRIAGDGLREHAVPIRLNDDTLFVAVSNLMWQRQLKDLAGQMVFKLNAALGSPVVSLIQFEIDENAVALAAGDRHNYDDAEMRRRAETELTPELKNAAATIQDETLREMFLAAAGICLLTRGDRTDRARKINHEPWM